MRLLFTTEYYPPFSRGGSPWSIRALAEALAGRGHQVTVVTPNYGAAEREQAGGVSVVRFPFWRRLGAGVTPDRSRDLVSPRFHWRLWRAAVREARRIHAEVIHAQDKHALVGSFLAARSVGAPVFLTVRDPGLICPIVTCLLSHDFVPADCSARKLQRECAPSFMDMYIEGGRFRRARIRANLAVLYADARIKRALMARLDGLVSVSRGLLEIYLRAGRGARERAHVVYSLPDAPRAAAADLAAAVAARHGLEGRDAVLYSGKLTRGKGWPVFREAMRQVATARPETLFVIAGENRPDETPPAEIRWVKHLPHDEMLALYGAVRFAVVPSVGPEALSRVPIEAAMASRPAIGTRVGGTAEEIRDGLTGLLVERGDAAGLARAMLRLLEDRAFCDRLGGAARRFVAEEFDPDAIVRSLVELYEAARR